MGNAATVRHAAAVRAAVRAAIREGAFGELPAGIKIGVRSGVDMIYVEIDGAPDGWSAEAGPSDGFPFGRRAGSDEACALAAKLAGVAREQAPGWTVRILLCLPDGDVAYLPWPRSGNEES
jgi:hypothetical protein